jgi:hypothetical protein
MAKRKQAPAGTAAFTAEELARETANAAADAARERAARRRRVNAEKQARFRKSMIAQGYKLKKYWEKPPAPGMIAPWGNSPPPCIQKTSAGICEKDAAIREAVKAMFTAFFGSMRGKNKDMNKEAWAVYKDIEALLSPIGYKAEV